MIKVNKLENTPPIYYGESTETKPTTNVEYASKWVEMNTGKQYYFNGTTWVEFQLNVKSV